MHQFGIVIGQPSAFQGFAAQVGLQPVFVWKAYFRWHLIDKFAPYLSKAVVDEDFRYAQVRIGVRALQPRRERALTLLENSLGEALGRVFVARHFPPAAKFRMEALVANVTQAFAGSLTAAEWMGEATRQEALEELAHLTVMIGYPNKWRDYSALTVSPDDLVGNVVRLRGVQFNREIARLREPVDRYATDSAARGTPCAVLCL